MTHGKRALIFSPGLAGHRQVYCRVVASVLTDVGYDVVVAGAMEQQGGPMGYPQLATLATRDSVQFYDTTALAGQGRLVDLATMGRLVRAQRADLTILLEADDHLRLLASQMRGRQGILPGRRVGVFLRSTNYVHSPDGTRRGGWMGVVKRGARAAMSDPRLFHEVYLPRFRLLDAALCLDEVFVMLHSATHQWMPDIADDDLGDGPAECEDEGRSTAALGEFLARHPERPVFVYFGAPQERRGYDLLLQVASEEGGVFVHAGRVDSSFVNTPRVAALRSALRDDGRLLETGGYVRSFAVAERFFASAPCIALPYRHHHGSSGVMLQALKAGRPVLVPDVGLMAERTRAHGLGRTFREGDLRDFRSQYSTLARTPSSVYADNIAQYLRSFTPDRLKQALRHAADGTGAPVGIPVPSTQGQG